MEGFVGFRPVPLQRIREKVNDYMNRGDYAAVGRHLLYWLEEARLGGDLRGQLSLRNELVGHYRKTGERDKALESGEEALRLLERLDLGGTVTEGTTCVNVATALSAFGENARALALFERARATYEGIPSTQPDLLGSLYNNMAVACGKLGRYDEALALFERAMALTAGVTGGGLEQAVTCLNMAEVVEAQLGMERGEARIYALLDRAAALLDAPDAPRDGYYAFVCEKCAPGFDYYGYFLEAERLREEAKRIYERD